MLALKLTVPDGTAQKSAPDLLDWFRQRDRELFDHLEEWLNRLQALLDKTAFGESLNGSLNGRKKDTSLPWFKDPQASLTSLQDEGRAVSVSEVLKESDQKLLELLEDWLSRRYRAMQGSILMLMCWVQGGIAVRTSVMANASADSEMPCALGLGRCCESKCNGEHVYHGRSDTTVTYTDCTVSENWEFQMVSPGKFKPVDRKLSLETKLAPGFDVPWTAKYFCQERCIISTPRTRREDPQPQDQKSDVLRAGGERSDAPVCAFDERLLYTLLD
ncbi:UVR8 [Symbiodinium natans]|uniref:UVR8 protein n=1 Tax=Symbiodinium natans TaxID=878477 RepID=A0A812SRG9_9DINO|nr:UVR8 [Symbiodinium natans]